MIARSAAPPRPPPRPAARAVLELDESPVGEEDVWLVGFAEAPADVAVFDREVVFGDPFFVVLPELVLVVEDLLDVLLPFPGHDVAPITVTVVGCAPPSLTAFLPV